MTGSLQIKNGKYYAVINISDINGNRKQKWISSGFEVKGNKKKAEKFLRDKLKEYELQENIVPSDILFSDYVLHWLSIAKLKIDESTFQSYNCIAKAHIIPYFKSRSLKLNEIKRCDIQSYINTKYESGSRKGSGGLSAKTVKSHMVIIKQAFTEAVKNNLILSNPCDYVVIPKIQKYETSFYNAEQLNKLFTAIKDEPLFPLVYLTAVFGLRRSEILGLKWDSISSDGNTLSIKHTVVDIAKRIEKDRTKNKASNRAYPISSEVKEILSALKKAEEKNRLLFGNSYIENDYIFKWENGSPFKPDYVSKAFRKLLEKNGFPIIRFHDLRHSCASLLVANGFTLKDIQEWLGHSDIQTTANIYAHLDIERKTNIMKTMTDSFNL